MLVATFSGDHVDAGDGTWLNAKIAASALIDNDGVHEFRCSENGIHRTRFYAFGAADALVLADIRNSGFGFDTVLHIQGLWFNVE